MMTTKRLDKFEVACEWDSCSFRGHAMEELSDHMSLHLKDYLGDKDALEELDEYACLWNGCEFLSMGSPTELEVHAYFRNYHGKLKLLGHSCSSPVLTCPAATLGLHSNDLFPEGSDGYVCQWEHCDVGIFYFFYFFSCDAFFKIRYRLREHMRSHTQERLVACPTCGSMFSSNTKLFDHLHRQAEPVESLVCEHCGKAFSSERLLRDHVRQHVNQVKCPFCDMTCTTLARPFPCDFCDKRFKNQRDLQKHTEVHNEGTVYHCTVEGCDYSCQTFQTMSHHFKRVHEVGRMSKYKCHICAIFFSLACAQERLQAVLELLYRKDVDGFLKVNMVRFETVEVTKEIMKNMAKKPPSVRKRPKSSNRNKRSAVTPESGRSSPTGSSSPSSSSSSSCSSEFSGGGDISSQPSPRGSDSPVYCVMSTIPHIEDEPGGLSQEDCDGSGTSGAVQALTEVARGLGMDVV
uniref:C2H2-type domain-containing protein n=1 Tax=Mastacembelus armatus TaxID=205130 RepID=A0A3Q3N3S4_9TELE